MMNSRERILAAINHQPVDRVPTDIWATGEVFAKIHAHFGEGDEFRNILHLDGFHYVAPQYIGPKIGPGPNGEAVDFWGIRTRSVSYGTGHYEETCYNPLAACETIDDLEKYNWPQANWFDYSKMKEAAAAGHDKKAVKCGYMALFYHHNLLRGLEASLMDGLIEPEFTHHMLGKIADFFYEHHRRMFEACDGLIDVAEVTDDFGTQTGPMISLEVFREFYRPHMQRFIDLAHEFGVKAFHHDDGAIRTFLPDLAEMGIDILNPVQWMCPGMELEGLKKDFGKNFCFHGGIENQQILPFGTPEEVRAEVRHNIDALASDGTGYILGPCHCLQAVSPIENIIAMYDEAWNYGKLK